KANISFEAAYEHVRQASAASDPKKRSQFMAAAGMEFDNGANSLAELAHALSTQLTEIKISLSIPTEGQTPIQQVTAKAQTVAEGLIGNAGLLDDPRASAVVYAPDRYWGRRFNNTFCKGSFGNTDCAVKMEGLGSFTLKGVRLDATKITQATFSVAREAIQ